MDDVCCHTRFTRRKPMAEMEIVCGAEMVPVRLDDNVHVIKQEPTLPLEPQPDVGQAVDRALASPIDRPPLPEMVRPGAKVTIAFDDPTVPCYAPVWEVALQRIVDQLVAGGVDETDITLLCANALHRQFTRDELGKIVGIELVERFDGRLLCHDAEDADNIIHLGTTAGGHEVELNRLAVDADLCIYLNTVCWRAFNGGWKSICVGLSSYRSIRAHHTPDAMSMSTEKNRMHEVLDEMGELCEQRLGTDHFFKVETVLANPLQVGEMWAGSIGATRSRVLQLQVARGQSRRTLLDDRADIICYGVPEWSPYAAFATMNPLLTLVSTGLGYLGGVIEALGKPGCSVILASPCRDEWDEVHHPSYREVWDRVLSESRDPHDIRDRFEEEFASREDYIDCYRHRFGFHPVHGIMATYPLKRLRHANRVYVAHAEHPNLVGHLGFEAAATVDDAIDHARSIHGRAATVALVRYPMAINR
jgi:hypothetical protein